MDIRKTALAASALVAMAPWMPAEAKRVDGTQQEFDTYTLQREVEAQQAKERNPDYGAANDPAEGDERDPMYIPAKPKAVSPIRSIRVPASSCVLRPSMGDLKYVCTPGGR